MEMERGSWILGLGSAVFLATPGDRVPHSVELGTRAGCEVWILGLVPSKELCLAHGGLSTCLPDCTGPPDCRAAWRDSGLAALEDVLAAGLQVHLFPAWNPSGPGHRDATNPLHLSLLAARVNFLWSAQVSCSPRRRGHCLSALAVRSLTSVGHNHVSTGGPGPSNPTCCPAPAPAEAC